MEIALIGNNEKLTCKKTQESNPVRPWIDFAHPLLLVKTDLSAALQVLA